MMWHWRVDHAGHQVASQMHRHFIRFLPASTAVNLAGSTGRRMYFRKLMGAYAATELAIRSQRLAQSPQRNLLASMS